ncbi:1-acyl-sn-glycerol-3-phosphate acyltransferase [Nisaea acidiphila]|uniref:1-acyl-sn-glycerol-3-phosphate acyltransferase n=1 Tax=Nisaea acidiphila TaxID=1862145 RepID=A0A9J7AXJ7_9PROT|nr:lysophospholipid acyltransferase family protein [Nisaea acidiphila]UUX52127.1 1-acyl-sn-glycerol-3-phosphate acyltransferase [Nisaea acidiphila]
MSVVGALEDLNEEDFLADPGLLGSWERSAEPLEAAGMVAPSRTLLWRRLALYGLLTCSLLPLQVLFVALRSPGASALPLFYHGLCARLLGFRVKTRGRPLTHGPVLYASNHASYFDIVVLGSLLRASFIAKSEVKGWPGFGLLAILQRTVFVERRRGRSKVHANEIGDRLSDGDRLVLFPEGTSNDGNRVLPFKSSMFAATQSKNPEERVEGLRVQPVSITYTRLNGMPMGRGLRPFYAWYGDMDLVPHLLDALALGRVDVEVEFHPPLDPAEFGNRKELAAHCERAVSRGVSRALSGRDEATI